MDPEVGRLVVLGITAIGAVVWLSGLVAMLQAERQWRESSRRVADRFDIDEVAEPGIIVGEADVEGDPEELSAKLSGLLARDGFGPFGPVRIVHSDARDLSFEPSGPSPIGFRGGRIRLTPAGSRTRIDYAIRAGSRGWLVGGWAALGLGLVALVAAPALAFALILPSPNPQIRTQAIQVVQMVHFLWPPFLFAYRAKLPARMIRSRIESLVHNLPYS